MIIYRIKLLHTYLLLKGKKKRITECVSPGFLIKIEISFPYIPILFFELLFIFPKNLLLCTGDTSIIKSSNRQPRNRDELMSLNARNPG